jgi:hypothetical protein
MLMIDVRNAIANILDRYTLAQVVEVTLRKMRRDGIAPPFSQKPIHGINGTEGGRKADPADGFLAGLTQLLPSRQDDEPSI